MPRTYKKTEPKVAESIIKKAVEDIKEKLSLCKAAEKYAIDKSKLSRITVKHSGTQGRRIVVVSLHEYTGLLKKQ